ncbi:MAG: TetR/AcrR family transcriptional regulator [Caulobacteraceae bacterium]
MPKRDENHMEAQRERIVRAVLECVADKGVERTSIADICRKAGMSTGAVYLHYRNKDDLVAAALRYATTTDKALPETWSKMVGLIVSLGDQLGFDIATIARIRLHLYAESVAPGQLHELYRPIMKRAFDEWATTLRTMAERGEIRLRMSPAQTARVIAALFDGLLWIALATDRPLEKVKSDLAASLACLVEDLTL